MTGNIEKSAWILSIGMVISALILGVVIGKSAKTLSNGIITGGTKARSHFSGGSFPSHLQVQLTGAPDIRVQLAEKLDDFDLDKRNLLMEAFERICVGRLYNEKKITKVNITHFTLSSSEQGIKVTCDSVFEDGSVMENCYAFLSPDGFGGFDGSLREKFNGKTMLRDIRIQ